MKSRIDHHVVRDLSHLDAFMAVCKPRLDLAFEASHAHCGQGFQIGDRVVTLRSFVLSGLDGLITADGPVLTTPERYTSPYKTTGLVIPSPLGAEHVMVNHVEPISGNRFKLSSECGSASGATQLNLIDGPDQVIDTLLGFNASHHRVQETDPMILRIRAYLIGGHYDRAKKLFYAVDQRILLDSTYGHGGEGGLPPTSAGPAPSLGRV